MAFDAGMMAAVVFELNTALENAKLEKINQPEKEEIHLIVRAKGQVRRLLLSASSACPRLCFTEQSKENPAVPPLFCTLLRKHLLGAKITSVQQIGFERVAKISFDAKDEMGFPVLRFLYCEILGKFSNLIFTDENEKILGVLRPVDFSTSEKRQLLPGMRYELPPPQAKTDPRELSKSDFFRRLSEGGLARAGDKALVADFLGLSPLSAREMLHLAGAAPGTPLEDCDGERLYTAFRSLMDRICRNDFAPSVVLDDGDGKPVEYAFFPITQYENGNRAPLSFRKEEGSASFVIETYFSLRARSETLHQKAQDILQLLTTAQGRLRRKIAAQEEELAACKEKESLRQAADLITANLYALKRGDEEVTLINYYSPSMEQVTLKLDKRLTPTANAQRYYKKYAKLKTAEEVLAKQLSIAGEELAYLETVSDSLRRAEGEKDLAEIRDELSQSGYGARLCAKGNKKTQKSGPRPPMEFVTDGGYTVLCGRNNSQNDALTFRIAEKGDWWFHVKNAPGSHVVLRASGLSEPDAADFTQAAVIAATYSSLGSNGGTATQSSTVTVDYTEVKNLKKPPASKPGYVIYHKNYAAYVAPDEKLCHRLRKK